MSSPRNMTVRQLIAALKKQNPDALVVWKDHDHGPGEFNSWIRYIDSSDETLDDEAGEGKPVIALHG